MITLARERTQEKIPPIHELVGLLQEAVWIFGGRAFDGDCCGGLSYLESQALLQIERSAKPSIQDVGRAVRLTKSGATRIIDRLERRGLVKRRRSAADGRVCCVAVTNQGRRVATAIASSYATYLDEVLKDLDARSLEMIATSLSFLIAAARRPRPQNMTDRA